MEFERSCFCWPEELGPFQVVGDTRGVIIAAVYLEGREYPGTIVSGPEDLNIFTIQGAFNDIQVALDQAYRINATYHAEGGFPTEIDIDWYGDMIDDEMFYTINNVSLVL